MENAVILTFASVLFISFVSILVIIPFVLWKKTNKKVLLVLLSLSAGTLLGGVFIHFLPESLENGYTLSIALYILTGFLVFFILEKFIHHHHSSQNIDSDDQEAHGHGYHLAPLNLVGDGVHNFIDGLVIAGSYMISIPLGIAATISVFFHELPQEIADFGVLIYSGLSRKKALLFNFLSALTAIIGAIVGVTLSSIEEFRGFIIPFAAGTFIYIAASNLVPELHRHCKIKDSIFHLLAILVGIGIMILVDLV